MTRLNIEDHAFSDQRLKNLSRKLKWDERQTLGMLCWLWKESQRQMKIEATEKEIVDWCLEDNNSIIQYLVAVEYIKLNVETGLYRICGNEEQISAMQKWYEQKILAGKKSAESRKIKNNEKATTVQRPFNDRSTTVQRNATDAQRNATQDQEQDQEQDQNTNYFVISTNGPQNVASQSPDASLGEPCSQNQINEPQTQIVVSNDKTPIQPKKKQPRVSKQQKQETALIPIEVETHMKKPRAQNQPFELWQIFAAKMKEVWLVELEIADMPLKYCKDLLKEVGFENAKKVIEYYPTRRKDWYVERGHNLRWCVQDSAALLREIHNGIKMTPAVVKKIVKAEENEAYDDRQKLGLEKNFWDDETTQISGTEKRLIS